MEARQPCLVDINVAGRARAGAATFGFQFDSPITNDLHDSPAFEGGQRMFAAIVIGHENNGLGIISFGLALFHSR